MGWTWKAFTRSAVTDCHAGCIGPATTEADAWQQAKDYLRRTTEKPIYFEWHLHPYCTIEVERSR